MRVHVFCMIILIGVYTIFKSTHIEIILNGQQIHFICAG